MIKGALFLSFLAVGICCCAQSRLMFKKNKNKIAYYETGDKISFRIKSEKIKFTELIRGFEDSVIVFKNFKINPSEITAMYVDNKTKVWYFLKYKYEKLFLFAGTGYLILDVLNSGELAKETIIISGSLTTAGLLAKWLISKRIKIKGRRRLVILNLD